MDYLGLPWIFAVVLNEYHCLTPLHVLIRLFRDIKPVLYHPLPEMLSRMYVLSPFPQRQAMYLPLLRMQDCGGTQMIAAKMPHPFLEGWPLLKDDSQR